MINKTAFSFMVAGLVMVSVASAHAAERPYQPAADIPVSVQPSGARVVYDPSFNPTALHTKQIHADAAPASDARFVPQPDPTFNPTYQHTKW